MYDAVRDSEIREIVLRAMRSIGRELYRRWSYHETKQRSLEDYITWRWERYANEMLHDSISRVCRDPERKLGSKDRLLGPINFIRRYAARSDADTAIVDILMGVAAAMRYSTELTGNRSDYATLRSRVLASLVNVDSALLDAAERRFESFRSSSNAPVSPSR